MRGDHRGQGRQADQRNQRPARCQQVERVTRCVRVFQQQCALAEVVEHQRRQHQQEPGASDRLAAEVAHVGVKRFGAGQRQHYRAEDRYAHARVHDEKIHRPHRVQRVQHFRGVADAVHTKGAEDEEPGDHDRPEQNADPRGTVALNQKQRDQHDQRQRHHPVIDAFKRQAEAFDRRQHRNGRGDHAVAIEQRRADQPAHHQQRAQALAPRRCPPCQCRQGHDAALALVVGAQDEHHVLDRDHPDQRPEDQRQNAQHAVVIDRHTITAGKHFLEGVQRARADVAINHPDRRDQHAQRSACRTLGARRMTTCLTHPTLLISIPASLKEALCFELQHALFYLLLQTND